MKKLLLLLSLIVLAKSLSAQQFQVGYIPSDVTVICDTNTSINTSNSSFWFVKDTATISITGSNNTLYFENATIYIANNGNNNTYYIKGSSHTGIYGSGKHNTIYMEGGTLRLHTDSNLAYVQNPMIIVSGSDNIIHTVTTNVFSNTGTNNSIVNDNTFNGVAFAYTNAPQNPCGETITSIVEDPISIDVYPNPATDNVTINLQNAGDVKTITIYDIAGKVVEVIAKITTDRVTVDTSKLSTGMYVYSITLANGKTERGKLLVG